MGESFNYAYSCGRVFRQDEFRVEVGSLNHTMGMIWRQAEAGLPVKLTAAESDVDYAARMRANRG